MSAISMRESNDINGQYFITLNTGKGIYYKRCEQIPIDEYMIVKVNKLATNEKEPMINNKYPLFEWISGLEIGNINVEENEENLDIVDNIRKKNEALINIRLDVVNQAIITDDNLDISYFDEDLISNIHQSTEDISLQIIYNVCRHTWCYRWYTYKTGRNFRRLYL